MKLNLSVPFYDLLDSLNIYWQSEISNLVNCLGVMEVPEMREFLALVRNNQQVFPDYDTILKRHPIGIGTTRYWYMQYAKARRELIEFLEKSIEADSPIKIKA